VAVPIQGLLLDVGVQTSKETRVIKPETLQKA
jgi:hypothetical protein